MSDLKPCFFSYDPLDNFRTHETADSARAEAERALSRYRDDVPDEGLYESDDQVCWGEIIGSAVRLNHRQKPTGRPLTEDERHEFGQLYELWDTKLAEHTRADTAELAALRAERDRLKEECAEHKQAVIDAMSLSNDMCDALEAQRDALRARAERAESDAAESKRRCGELAELLESVWSGVLEMKKDARTDYELPRLAQLDLESILSHSARVAAALTPEASK